MVDGGDALVVEPLDDLLGELAGDARAGVDAVGLESLGSDAVVPDERVGEGQHLLLVGGVGQALFVSGVGGRKDQFTTAPTRDTATRLNDAAVLQGEIGVRHYEIHRKPRPISLAFEAELRNSQSVSRRRHNAGAWTIWTGGS